MPALWRIPRNWRVPLALLLLGCLLVVQLPHWFPYTEDRVPRRQDAPPDDDRPGAGEGAPPRSEEELLLRLDPEHVRVGGEFPDHTRRQVERVLQRHRRTAARAAARRAAHCARPVLLNRVFGRTANILVQLIVGQVFARANNMTQLLIMDLKTRLETESSPEVLAYILGPYDRAMRDISRTFHLNCHSCRVVGRDDMDATEYEMFEEYTWFQFDHRTYGFTSLHKCAVYLMGYYQSWYYLHGQEQVISEFMTILPDVRHGLDSWLHDVRRRYEHTVGPADEVTFVGVHVRRGDYAHNSRLKRQGWRVPGATYFQKAMTYMNYKHRNVIFVVCGNDARWARAHLGAANRSPRSMVVFSRNPSAAQDLALLTLMNHTVMSVGSFGWLAGLRTRGDVVFYRDFITPASAIDTFHRSLEQSEFFPPGWIGLA